MHQSVLRPVSELAAVVALRSLTLITLKVSGVSMKNSQMAKLAPISRLDSVAQLQLETNSILPTLWTDLVMMLLMAGVAG